jgi:hypothetical protein
MQGQTLLPRRRADGRRRLTENEEDECGEGEEDAVGRKWWGEKRVS